jgi:hypothetical protein
MSRVEVSIESRNYAILRVFYFPKHNSEAYLLLLIVLYDSRIWMTV